MNAPASSQPQEAPPQQRSGLPFAIGAYTLWGFIPMYLVLLNAVSPFALVGWRIVWTVPICILIVLLRGQWPDMKAALSSKRTIALLVVSSVLITVNWVTYIIAVQRGAFYAASLGYYINPLVNVLLGTVFLRERLSRFQWLAVGVAGIGIAILALEAGDTLYISLLLAGSFSFYGLVRKWVPVGALPGLTIEGLVLVIPAAITIALTPNPESGIGAGWQTQALLFGAGIWTAVPLLLFATAARRMDYSTLGFVQFLAPTIVFILGLTVLKETLDMLHLVSFIFIWVAIAIFCADLLHRNRAKRRPVPA